MTEYSALINRLRLPRLWKFIATLFVLLIVAVFFELMFVAGKTTSVQRSNISNEKYTADSKRLIKEAEKLAVTSRDNLARDEKLIQAIESKDRKRILREVYTRDSLLHNDPTNFRGVHSSDDFTFAVYDSAAHIVGWNSGAAQGNEIDNRFSPTFDISKRVKGVFFEETPSKLYLTAFHKLFDKNEKYVGYIVIKLFLSNKEISSTSLHSDAHEDLFSDLEKEENIIIRLASTRPSKISGDSILTYTSVPLEEGGPLSTIHVTVIQPTIEASNNQEWNFLSAIRDLLVLLLVSTIFFSIFATHIYKTMSAPTVKALVYGVGAILLYGAIFRYTLYIIGAGHSLLPPILTLTSDFAFQSLFVFSDSLELLLSSFVLTSVFLSLFLLLTTKKVKEVVVAKNAIVILLTPICFVVIISILSFFTSWFVELVTNNCSFDLSELLHPLAPTKYLVPLLSLFIVTVSTIVLTIGLFSLLSSLLVSQYQSKRTIQFVISIVLLLATTLQILLGGTLMEVGAYSIGLAGLLSLASTIKFRFTPRSYEMTRSPIVALTLASLTCFILAPAIKSTNFNKQKQNLEQSILSKAGFQFTTAALQLPESLNSERSILAQDTIVDPALLPVLLLKEHERLRSEIEGANIRLIVRDSKDSLVYFVGNDNIHTNDSNELISHTIPIFVGNGRSDSSKVVQQYKATALLTNDLLEIGPYESGTFLLLYNNDKLENSTQTTFNIPVTLIDEIKAVSGKGSWLKLEIDGKDAWLFVKSIYSINSQAPEKILVGGIVDYSIGDILVFAVRYNTLALVLAAFVILIALALTNNISVTRFTLRFRERIFLIIFVIALVPLVFVSNITRTVLQSRESDDQRRGLIAESEKVANVVRPLLNGDSKLISPLILDLSHTLEHRIDVYDGNGILLTSSAPELYEAFLLSRLMSLDILYSALVREQTATYQERVVHDKKITTSYQTIYDKSYNTLLGIVAITRIDSLLISANEIAATASLIYGTFSLIALLLLIIGSYVSYRVASPLQDMITATERVARGEFGTQVSLNRKDEIGDLASAFNRMTKELESTRDRAAQSEREGAWKEMARQVAHEIKNPLTPMKLSVQHVQHAHEVKDTNFSAVFTRVMKTLSEQIDVLTRIASEFSRFGEMPRRRYAFVSLKKVVESALSLFDAERAHIRFVADIPDKIASIYADEEEFRRTLVNLLRNAVQAMDGWGMIVITATESNGIIHLSIKDTGAGMSEETLNKAFDPNFSTKTSGMGLGLAIVKRTITDMSGTIRVESTLGKGTTFHIDLPARTV
jgi:nitrogen fixation/metabolism regulation signal transduction histidine kinase